MSERLEQQNEMVGLDEPTKSTVASCEQTVAQLEERIEQHKNRAAELASARRSSAYAARDLNDAEQSKALDGIIEEMSKHAIEGDALTDALDEAKRRLEQAKEREAHSADRAQAKADRELVARYLAQAERTEASWVAAIADAHALDALAGAMGAAGFAPSGMQRVTFSALAVHTHLMGLPPSWRRSGDFRHLGSREKRTFVGPPKEWAAGAERNIATRLGEQQTNKPEHEAA